MIFDRLRCRDPPDTQLTKHDEVTFLMRSDVQVFESLESLPTYKQILYATKKRL